MIAVITGKLLSKAPPQVVIDVQGVGYELEVPMSTLFALPEVGSPLTLHTHLTIREDAHLLFGFASLTEKALFRELIKLSGIGPKLALAVLSGGSVDDFWSLVRAQDSARLTKIPGVGKKTAERIVLEFKDKAGSSGHPSLGRAMGTDHVSLTPLAEARAALESLGYKPAEASRLTDALSAEDLSTDAILREALKRAAR